ncbi:MAG: potassium channel family protein [Planctomycetota bacterium]
MAEPEPAPRKWSTHRYRHLALLVVLAGVVFGRPLIEGRSWAAEAIDLTLLAALAGGAAAVSGSRRLFVPMAVLAGLCAAVLTAWHFFAAPDWVAVVGLGLTLTFLLLVAGVFVHALMRYNDRIGLDTLCNAVSTYLLIGLAWAVAYVLLEALEPGSFTFAGDLAADQDRFHRLLGFSFVTLTTLGYGNVAPATARADALATLQAVVGQGYVAIVIARLVAMQITQAQQERRGDG